MVVYNLEKEIKKTIAEVFKVSEEVIIDSLSIGDIPEWDSMGNMNLMRALEENFNIDIPLEDLFELTSVTSIIEEVRKLVNA